MTHPTIPATDPRLKLRGVSLHGNKWRVERNANGQRQRVVFALDATAADLVDAWERLAAATVTVVAGGLADAVARYLKTVSAKPTAGQIETHLAIMLREFGRDRAVTSVTPADVDVAIQKWLTTPTVIEDGKRGRPSGPHGLANDTIRKRLANWQSFFNAVLPDDAANPVKQCKQRPAPTPPATRGVPLADLVRILDAMPTYRDTKPGAPRQLSLGKLRAAVWAYAGLDPAQIKALKPSDLSLSGPAPQVRTTRAKGDGVAIVWNQLTDPGRDALVAFRAADAFGDFSESALTRSIKRAAVVAGFPWGTFRGKDLRHSFGTHMYRLTHDLATVGRFLNHAPGSPMTARYARAAFEDVDRAAADKFVLPTVATPAPVVSIANRRRRDQ